MLDKLCAPAILYIAFSLTQIIIDVFKTMYNTAFIKFIVMIVFALALNVLCSRGLGVISWFIVFVPFILMTIVTSILLFVFGLSPFKGGLNYTVDYPGQATSAVGGRKVVVVQEEPAAAPTTSSGTTADSYDPNDMTSGTPSDINNYN